MPSEVPFHETSYMIAVIAAKQIGTYKYYYTCQAEKRNDNSYEVYDNASCKTKQFATVKLPDSLKQAVLYFVSGYGFDFTTDK